METNKNNKHSRQERERGHQMTLVFRQSTRHRKEKKKVSRGIKMFWVARTGKGPRVPGWWWPGYGGCQTPCGRQEQGTRYPPGSSLWAEIDICVIPNNRYGKLANTFEYLLFLETYKAVDVDLLLWSSEGLQWCDKLEKLLTVQLRLFPRHNFAINSLTLRDLWNIANPWMTRLLLSDSVYVSNTALTVPPALRVIGHFVKHNITIHYNN